MITFLKKSKYILKNFVAAMLLIISPTGFSSDNLYEDITASVEQANSKLPIKIDTSTSIIGVKILPKKIIAYKLMVNRELMYSTVAKNRNTTISHVKDVFIRQYGSLNEALVTVADGAAKQQLQKICDPNHPFFSKVIQAGFTISQDFYDEAGNHIKTYAYDRTMCK